MSMTRPPSLLHHLVQLLCTLLVLLGDAVRFLRLCLRSPAALAAENLFLRQQLALYQERHITPQRATLDDLIPLSANHLGHILTQWVPHYNTGRPHMSLGPGISPSPPHLPMPLQVHRHRLPEQPAGRDAADSWRLASCIPAGKMASRWPSIFADDSA